MKGLKQDPSEWSKQELLERVKRMGQFLQDKKTSSCSLRIEGKRLLKEDIAVVKEILRRATETQVVRLINCGINDEAFVEINIGLKCLRHLKVLSLEQNVLTSVSAQALIDDFAKLSRPLEDLDLRSNNLTYKDGWKLYTGFKQINTVNGIDKTFFTIQTALEVVDLENSGMKVPEMGILNGILQQNRAVNEVKLGRNKIGPKALDDLIELINNYPSVERLDLSYNPLSNEETDFYALEHLATFANTNTQLKEVKLDGVTMPKQLKDRIEHSLMVNRSINGGKDKDHFSKFLKKRIEQTAPPLPDYHLNEMAIGKNTEGDEEIEWEDIVKVYKGLDINFAVKNNLPNCRVQLLPEDILLHWDKNPKHSPIPF